MHPLLTEEVSDIEQRISWIAIKLRGRTISFSPPILNQYKLISGNSEDFYERFLLAEIDKLQKEKTKLIKKSVVEQIAEVSIKKAFSTNRHYHLRNTLIWGLLGRLRVPPKSETFSGIMMTISSRELRVFAFSWDCRR